MADPKEQMKKKIEDLKGQLAKQKEAGKDLRNDPNCRQLRKTLKRSQRRLALLVPLTFEQKNARVDKFLELMGNRMSELTKESKNTAENAYVHSLRKKVKSLNKQKKRLDRQAKKLAAKNPPPAEGGEKPTEK